MLNVLLQLLIHFGVVFAWVSVFAAAVVAVFVAYIGIAMVVALRTSNTRRAERAMAIFTRLLSLFKRSPRRRR